MCEEGEAQTTTMSVAFASPAALSLRGVRRRGRAACTIRSEVPTNDATTADAVTSNGHAVSTTAPAVAPRAESKVKPATRPMPSVPRPSNRRAPGGDFCTIQPATLGLKRVLIVHCGGTFGMIDQDSFDPSGRMLPGTGGAYREALKPAGLLADILEIVPELRYLANLDVHVAMNLDSARIGPAEWIRIAKILHRKRDAFDAFIVIHGTDTLAYSAAACSLMLAGFGKPVVFTGSQLPMLRPRSDARQNLIDSVTVATDGVLEEVSLCFGGQLLRANRAQKTSSTAYRAFSSPTHPPLASLGVDIEWNASALWKCSGVYRPRFKLETNVCRIPIVPGIRPDVVYGDLYGRGVRGAVLESFGVGNMPDTRKTGWIDWLKTQRKKGLEVYLASQCTTGPLHPELYRSGSAALAFGATSTRRMTAETAVIKLMLCLAHQDLHLSFPLAGEL